MNAQRHEIINEVLGLSQHYLRTVRTPEQEERFLRDYIEDLADYPISAIKLGCKAWRNSDATKFPTPGQLVARVRANLPQRERGSPAESWKPLSDSEYEGLSLRDKIRHRLIVAAALRRKAGPMWRNGVPLTVEEMPEHWHELMRKAEAHAAEAKRLRETLDQFEQRA